MLLCLLFSHCFCEPKITKGRLMACPTDAVFQDTYDNVINSYALQDCTNTKTLKMANSIQYIGIYAFSGCSSLTTVTWSQNLVEIADRAFNGCSSLKKLILPPKVRDIGIFAFYGMPALEQIQFPETLRLANVILGNSPLVKMSIVNTGGTAQFEVKNNYYFYTKGCVTLKYVTPHADIKQYSLDSRCTVLDSYSGVYSRCGPTLNVPAKIKSVGGWAWQYSSTITKISFGSAVTSISSAAFNSMNLIAEFAVDSANTVYSSYQGAIYNKARTKLEFYPVAKTSTTLTLPKAIAEFGEVPFTKKCVVKQFIFEGNVLTGNSLKITSDKKSLLTLDGKEYVRSVPDMGIDSDYTVPNGVQIIRTSGFTETKVRDITLPASCTTIQPKAFFECELHHINLDKVTDCGRSPFQGAHVQSLTIPGCWGVIRDCFCRVGYELTQLTICEGIKIIEAQAFDTIKAETVTLPQSLERIEKMAFYGNYFKVLNLPTRCLNYIGEEAFAYNTNLTSVTITSCVATVDHRAFSMCKKLTLATIKNCETYWSPDAFLSTERKVQVVCIATRRFTPFPDIDLLQAYEFTPTFLGLFIMANTLC